jgi:hypothetical protein
VARAAGEAPGAARAAASAAERARSSAVKASSRALSVPIWEGVFSEGGVGERRKRASERVAVFFHF